MIRSAAATTPTAIHFKRWLNNPQPEAIFITNQTWLRAVVSCYRCCRVRPVAVAWSSLVVSAFIQLAYALKFYAAAFSVYSMSARQSHWVASIFLSFLNFFCFFFFNNTTLRPKPRGFCRRTVTISWASPFELWVSSVGKIVICVRLLFGCCLLYVDLDLQWHTHIHEHVHIHTRTLTDSEVLHSGAFLLSVNERHKIKWMKNNNKKK